MQFNKNINNSRVVELFDLMYNKLNHASIINIIKLINPILLDNKYYDKEIMNPFNAKFNEFKVYVDQIDEPIYKEFNKEMKNNITQQITIIEDYTVSSEILFECNNIKYYGYRNIVYNSIKLLKCLLDCDCDEVIKLDIDVPKYIMNMYINSCYTNTFNINNIKSDDLILFLKFIDRYPTNFFSIDTIEKELIKYLEKHNININELIKELCERYQLKYMYIYIHNHEYK
jgi:hypothetical protein